MQKYFSILLVSLLFFSPILWRGTGGEAVAQSIDSVEYFFDVDPGIGNANKYGVIPGDSITDSISFTFPGLSPGFHNLFFRVQDTNGIWSLYETAMFYVQDTMAQSIPQSHPIAAAEYFYDTDPGAGNGIAMNAFSFADSILLVDTLPTAPLTAGIHNLFIRVRDTLHTWSLYEGISFAICNFVPSADFSADTACQNSPTTFTDLSTNLDTNYTYGWDFNNDSIIDDTTSGNTTFTFLSSGTHTVSLLVNNTNGCINTVVKTIYVDSLPTVTLALPFDTICKDDTLLLVGGSPAGGVYSGNGVYGGALYCDSVDAGVRSIFYTYYNSDSCSVKVTDDIYISHCTGVPEYNFAGYTVSISPNPFHTNTVLTVESSQNKWHTLEFVLFDVFGKEIRNLKFETRNLKLERENIPTGIYLYKVTDQKGNYVSGKLIVTD